MDMILWVFFLGLLATGAVVFYFSKLSPKTKVLPQESYVQALRALLDNDVATAFARLKETVLADSGNIDAYLRLSALLREQGRVRKALQLDQDLNLRQTLSPTDRGAILESIAEDHLALKQYDEAEKILDGLRELPEKRASATSKSVKLAAARKDWRRAFDLQVEYLKLNNEDDKRSLAEFKIKRGEELAAEKHYHDARVEFKDALRYNPRLAEAVVAIGDSYETEGRLEDAVRTWKRIVEVDAARADMVFSRVKKVLFDLGQFSEIEDFYHQVLTQDPRNLQALLGLASLAEKRGEGREAEDYYFQVLEINPEFLPALLGLIRFYQKQHRTDDAARVINQTAKAFLHF